MTKHELTTLLRAFDTVVRMENLENSEIGKLIKASLRDAGAEEAGKDEKKS